MFIYNLYIKIKLQPFVKSSTVWMFLWLLTIITSLMKVFYVRKIKLMVQPIDSEASKSYFRYNKSFLFPFYF